MIFNSGYDVTNCEKNQLWEELNSLVCIYNIVHKYNHTIDVKQLQNNSKTNPFLMKSPNSNWICQ